MHIETYAPARDAARPFTRWRFAGFGVVVALLALTAASLVWPGLQFGLDFSGGVLVEAQAAARFDVGALRSALAQAGIPEAVVQLSDGGTTALVRTQSEGGATIEAIRTALGPAAEIRRAEMVGPRVSGELLRSGVLAALGSVTAIALYVWLRFEAKFGAAAFLTTLHDVVVLVGFYAVTGLSFDLTSIAALLAIAGYSINDTVVVFDRVREALGRMPGASDAEAIDRAITDTLRRNLMTSGTTLAATVSLMIFGGPVLFGFAAAISFGIVLGTFSSIFVAAPLLLHLPGRMPGRGAGPGAADNPWGADAP